MKPGDRVRLIHGKEEGKIIKLLPNNQVEIEIEDGFRIPVLAKEVVIVSKAEEEIFSTGATGEPVFQEYKGSGLWLGALPFNDKIYSLHIINDTGFTLLFTLNTQANNIFEGQYQGILSGQKETKVLELKSDEFSSWPEIIVQGLLYKPGESEYKKPFEIRFKFKADNFFKRKANLPLINKAGFLFGLQVEQEAVKLEELKNALNENRENTSEDFKITKPSKEIDLHIDKLTTQQNLSNGEMLRIQMEAFQKALDAAIATNMDEIIFIHGVGNGILRNEIHKKLAATKGLKFFEDAAKEKFGYGATKVRIR